MERLLLPLKKLLIVHSIKSTLGFLFFSGLFAKLTSKTLFNISDFAGFNYLYGMKSNEVFFYINKRLKNNLIHILYSNCQ